MRNLILSTRWKDSLTTPCLTIVILTFKFQHLMGEDKFRPINHLQGRRKSWSVNSPFSCVTDCHFISAPLHVRNGCCYSPVLAHCANKNVMGKPSSLQVSIDAASSARKLLCYLLKSKEFQDSTRKKKSLTFTG